MKKYILITTLLMSTATQAGIFKGRYQGEMPKSCEVVFSKDYVETTGSIKGDVAEVMHRAITYTKRILDLKFESYAYFVANRNSYGEFQKYSQIKMDFEIGVKNAEDRKKDKIEESNILINDLAKLEASLAKQIYRDISDEREDELERNNQIISDLNRHWDKNKKYYYQSVAVWAPYQNNLQNLAKLEDSLMETLKRLSEIDSASEESLKEIVSEIRTWRQEEATIRCQAIDQKLQEMAKKH